MRSHLPALLFRARAKSDHAITLLTSVPLFQQHMASGRVSAPRRAEWLLEAERVSLVAL